MESKIVIKVKNGQTLRRFNASIGEDGKLELDITKLREKISSLFGYSPEAFLKLSYVDEDGDMVALIDEDDLHDVMDQALNPLRITVIPISKFGSKFSATSYGSPQLDLNSLSNVLKSIPEPLRESLSKLSMEVASKAACTGQVIARLVDSVSKLGQSLNAETSRTDIPTQKSEIQTSNAFDAQNANIGTEGFGSGSVNGNDDSHDISISSVNGNDDAHGISVSSVNGNDDSHDISVSSVNGNDDAHGISVSSVNGNDDAHGISVSSMNGNGNAHGISVSSVNSNDDAHRISVSSGFNSKPKVEKTNATVLTKPVKHAEKDTRIANEDSVMANKFNYYPGVNAISEYPFSGTCLSYSGIHCESPLKTSYKCSPGSTSNAFHKDIQCDGCGVHPILGPRFNSKLKADYDLCRICFASFGNDDDYIRMDNSDSSCSYQSFKGTDFPVELPSHDFQEIIENDGPKLDSHFVMDINILDGTVLAPSTSFTKIWRMKNNGNISWPKGTKLVWIGGHTFSSGFSFEAQAIANGLAVDGEINIAVDFCAPEIAGRYISYWRLATPSGQKFGQRVWVIINVDTALIDPVCLGSNSLNLNLPPVDCGVNDIYIHMIDAHQNKEPIAETDSKKDQEPHYPVYGSWSVGCSDPPPTSNNSIHPSSLLVDGNSFLTDAAMIHHPHDLFDMCENTSPFSVSPLATWPPIAASPRIQQTHDDNYDVEQKLLVELGKMGFKNINLNQEILKMNKYDLKQSIDDLCHLGEWDPIMSDLQELKKSGLF